MQKTRRTFLKHLGLGAATIALLPYANAGEKLMNWLTLSSDDWKKRLSPEAYAVLRGHGTERANSSPLNDEHRAGTFHCAGCDLPLYTSTTKFESGTGWPSFYDPLPNAVESSTDWKLLYPRTEVHCARCKGHLGHVFDDGPQPTGKRYCMNGIAMVFKAAS